MSDQAMIYAKPLFGKVVLKGRIMCLTGLHIGTSREALEIGGLDAPVLRDPATNLPYIPGSSLKGKMRSLLERHEGKRFNRDVGSPGNSIRQHVCDSGSDAYNCTVCRLFGSTGREGNFPARLSVRDCKICDSDSAAIDDEKITEVKFENSLDRITAAANPRQIERVTAGVKFSMELVYDVETQSLNGELNCSLDHVNRDLENILMLLGMIEDDSIGGHGSRGYGKVKFEIDTFQGLKTSYYGLPEGHPDREKHRAGRANQPGSIDDFRTEIGAIVTLFREEAAECSGTSSV